MTKCTTLYIVLNGLYRKNVNNRPTCDSNYKKHVRGLDVSPSGFSNL